MNAIIPIPQSNVSVRDATLDDVAFIDRLQKLHSDRVGFMRESWIVAKIGKGEVIVAEDGGGERVGYCMGVDRYFKRDDVGIIHQMNVLPGRQRKFVGAALLKAMFERSAYGCRLFCCWCAQDIEASHFWEAMGFVPLAFRAGSEKKARVHIFWEKRIRSGDTATPWWFPAKTDGGVIRADRIVLPIPPGKHWSDEMPLIVPQETAPKQLPAERKPVKRTAEKESMFRAPKQFGAVTTKPVAEPVRVEKPKREKKPKAKADPRLIAAAREVRDRWLEHVNAGEMLIEDAGKYDVSRAVTSTSAPTLSTASARLLPAA